MRWSLGDLAGKREPCKLQGKADPFESHIIPWTEGISSVGHEYFPVGCSRVWPAPNTELSHPQKCFILTLNLRLEAMYGTDLQESSGWKKGDGKCSFCTPCLTSSQK